VCVVAALLLVAGCGSDRPDRDRRDPGAGGTSPRNGGDLALLIDFEDTAEVDSPLTSFSATEGNASIRVVSAGSGTVRIAQGAESAAAARFPTSDEAASGSLAVLNLSGGPDTLAPGPGAFQFGIDVFYPAGSAGDSSGDDGDNLVQRGLFGDQGQYKLQVDHGRPACRIAGDEGDVLVKARLTLEPDQWYRLLCQRDDGTVTLFAAEIDTPSDDLDWRSWDAVDRAGSIPATDPSPSVSIGGKLNPAGGIVQDAPDQFSGLLDNVFFRSFVS
jgi:hypothetical protein